MNSKATTGSTPGPPAREYAALRLVPVVLSVLVAVGATLVFLTWSCRAGRPLPTVPPLPAAPDGIDIPETVRVLLAKRRPELTVECPGGGVWHWRDEEGARRVAETGTGPWTVQSTDGRIVLNGKSQPAGDLELLPVDGLLRVEGTAYRGSLLARPFPEGVSAFNVLDSERYLRGVVGAELYRSWPLEALMAQAVAARTFMLYAVAAKGYVTRVDMAYRGVAKENGSADLACELTRGIILTYADRVLPAYFQSTCGGHTASVDKVFAEEVVPPLAGVSCDWCRASKWYDWRADFSADQVAQALQSKGADTIRTVQTLETEGTEPDGYARFVLVNGEVRISGAAFRLALGGNVIRSPNFRVEPRAGGFRFEGLGFGHGVGLCQWGARGGAKAGATWQDILLHYYPGATICRAY